VPAGDRAGLKDETGSHELVAVLSPVSGGIDGLRSKLERRSLRLGKGRAVPERRRVVARLGGIAKEACEQGARPCERRGATGARPRVVGMRGADWAGLLSFVRADPTGR